MAEAVFISDDEFRIAGGKFDANNRYFRALSGQPASFWLSGGCTVEINQQYYDDHKTQLAINTKYGSYSPHTTVQAYQEVPPVLPTVSAVEVEVTA